VRAELELHGAAIPLGHVSFERVQHVHDLGPVAVQGDGDQAASIGGLDYVSSNPDSTASITRADAGVAA
jgi:hypothetical protein